MAKPERFIDPGGGTAPPVTPPVLPPETDADRYARQQRKFREDMDKGPDYSEFLTPFRPKPTVRSRVGEDITMRSAPPNPRTHPAQPVYDAVGGVAGRIGKSITNIVTNPTSPMIRAGGSFAEQDKKYTPPPPPPPPPPPGAKPWVYIDPFTGELVEVESEAPYEQIPSLGLNPGSIGAGDIITQRSRRDAIAVAEMGVLSNLNVHITKNLSDYGKDFKSIADALLANWNGPNGKRLMTPDTESWFLYGLLTGDPKTLELQKMVVDRGPDAAFYAGASISADRLKKDILGKIEATMQLRTLGQEQRRKQLSSRVQTPQPDNVPPGPEPIPDAVEVKPPPTPNAMSFSAGQNLMTQAWQMNYRDESTLARNFALGYEWSYRGQIGEDQLAPVADAVLAEFREVIRLKALGIPVPDTLRMGRAMYLQIAAMPDAKDLMSGGVTSSSSEAKEYLTVLLEREREKYNLFQDEKVQAFLAPLYSVYKGMENDVLLNLGLAKVVRSWEQLWANSGKPGMDFDAPGKSFMSYLEANKEKFMTDAAEAAKSVKEKRDISNEVALGGFVSDQFVGAFGESDRSSAVKTLKDSAAYRAALEAYNRSRSPDDFYTWLANNKGDRTVAGLTGAANEIFSGLADRKLAGERADQTAKQFSTDFARKLAADLGVTPGKALKLLGGDKLQGVYSDILAQVKGSKKDYKSALATALAGDSYSMLLSVLKEEITKKGEKPPGTPEEALLSAITPTPAHVERYSAAALQSAIIETIDVAQAAYKKYSDKEDNKPLSFAQWLATEGREFVVSARNMAESTRGDEESRKAAEGASAGRAAYISARTKAEESLNNKALPQFTTRLSRKVKRG